ncbi:MAG: hypothetical protein A3F10_06920 [Coxiella sp. RIFCSPHIGHO2_12_FULL_42_15]|nr:MAG: hypothetical protein A3F10_06920 [Coxiella sp. RIFCSPHIGHO2_12_FULL_42_15]
MVPRKSKSPWQATGYFSRYNFACAKQVRATATKGEHSLAPLWKPHGEKSRGKPRGIKFNIKNQENASNGLKNAA